MGDIFQKATNGLAGGKSAENHGFTCQICQVLQNMYEYGCFTWQMFLSKSFKQF